MPNRIVRESILSSEAVCSLKWDEEVFYRRLMSVVDDYGRCEASPVLLRSRCYPLQTDHVRVADISRWMAACQKAGLILVYVVDGKQYIELQKFNQQRRSVSRYPSPASDISCNHLLANAHLDVVVFEDVVGNTSASAEPDLLEDIDPQVVRDFKALRKAKKAAITPTVIAGIKREAEKVGYTLETALRTCCERGWQGFKAEWVTGDSASQPVRRQRKELS